jgi:Cys-rich four helix bundle protein (predicted Tat secretion target)
MNRRQFIAAGATSMAAVVATRAVAQATEASGATKTSPSAFANPKNRELADTAAACVKTGEVCMEHCLEQLRTGDKSMAKCSVTVAEMLPMCRALAALATQGSKHLAAHAATCGKVCRDCEAECKVHASHHQSCKDCMEACQRCAAACEKYAA